MASHVELPAWALAVFACYLVTGVDPSQPPPPPMLSGPILGALAVLVLLFDRRRFAGDPVPEQATSEREALSWTGG